MTQFDFVTVIPIAFCRAWVDTTPPGVTCPINNSMVIDMQHNILETNLCCELFEVLSDLQGYKQSRLDIMCVNP